jgi:hypothetical protein
MDIYTRAAAWATAAIMENELINGTVGFLGKYVDAEDVKFLANLASLVESSAIEYIDPGLKGAFDDVVVGDLTESLIEYAMELGAEFTGGQPGQEASLDAEIKADAEQAVATIEELSDRLGEVVEQEPRESEREITDLQREFEAEQQHVMDKIDKMENAYFEKYPDLDENQRGDAAERFEEIRSGELESLGERQDARLDQMMTRDERS